VHGNTEDGRRFGGQSFPVIVNDGDEIDISEPIVLPEVMEVTELPEGGGEVEVAIEGGLSVMIDPALAKSPDFSVPSELGGTLVDPAYWRYTEVNGEAMIAAWSFAPFGVKATEGSFGMAFTDGLGLDPDSAVNLYEIEKDNSHLHLVGTGTVNGDATGIDVVSAGEGLHELTWLIVTQ